MALLSVLALHILAGTLVRLLGIPLRVDQNLLRARVLDIRSLNSHHRQVPWTDDGGMEIRGPKDGSERTIFTPDGLVTILSEHVRLYLSGDDPDRWLFPGSRDTSLPAHAATVSRWWRIVRDRVGIPYRLHDCRHFYAPG